MQFFTGRCLPLAVLFLLAFSLSLSAQEVLEDRNFIRIDQFGYPTTSSKVAVIARAREGYNAGSGIELDPGAAVEVVRQSDEQVAFSGPARAWNGGSLDEVSGDLGYWFDFTGLTDTGTYVIRLTKADGSPAESYPFRIADDVYADVLRVAMEFFYYQRVNQEKTADYASGEPWTDGAWFDRPDQEYAVMSLADSTQTRSMPKGWFDAGDPNKYVTFATDAVHALLTTYDQYPDFWNDFSLRIPEGDNDIPDLLDEIRWETDWLESMQDYDPTDDSGSGGFYQKMGILEDGSYISPPSTDTRDRWHNGICVNSTITGAGMLAHAALTYERAGVWPEKVAELRERAEAAWQYYLAAPDKTEQCDDGKIEAGDADGAGAHYSEEHLAEAATTAAYLFALTGKQEYSNFVAANYLETRPWKASDWGIYRGNQAEAMLFYATLDGADDATKQAILAEKTSTGKSEGGNYVVSESDNLYRALPVYFNWGSNSLVSRQAANILDFIHYDLKEDNHPAYQARAQSIINYLHGTNPSGICMLSNMYRYGAELCADEMWHSWFSLDTRFDNIDGDNVGPAPGFLSGGPNPQGNGNMRIKLGTHSFDATAGDQPDQKAFSVDNHWEYGPWAYNEPAIYYQANYIKALAHFVAGELPALAMDVTTGPANDCREAEDIFTIANEAGGNATIFRDANSPGSSGGASVALFDEGDAALLSFAITETRNYDLAVRVRVGEQEDDNLNGLAGLYTLILDGDTLDYTYDTLSRSPLQGDTYWGEIVIVDVALEAGNHELIVAAGRDWLKLDRLCWRDPNSIVTPPVPRAPFLGAAVNLPGSIQAENYDIGGPGVAYSDSDGSNNGGAYRPGEAVDIGGSEEDGYSVGWVSENEWLEYTVNVTAAGAYRVSGALASPNGGGRLRVSFANNAASTTLILPEGGTGGFSDFDTVAASTPVFLSVGEQIMRLTIVGGPAFNIDSLTFTFDSTATGAGIINYFDDLATADTLLTGEPTGITYEIEDGVLIFAGSGTSTQYQAIEYTLPDEQLANAVASNNRLYLGVRTASGEAVDLRVDLVDNNDHHTTLGSVTRVASGEEFNEIVYDYSNAYRDEGYGGTGCSVDDRPCPVDGSVIRSIVFYPEPVDAAFNDILYIDYLSFGQPIADRDTSGGVPTGMVNYGNRLDDSEDAFSGNPNGLTFGVETGIFYIAGDGTATPYQTIDMRLRENGEPVVADVVGSGDLLYLRARTVGGDTVDLRVDLVDVNDYNTTNGGRSTTIAGNEFAVYSIDFAGGYEDGGYGGTGCTEADRPCAVDGQRITGLRFYPNAVTGGFNDTLEIDWISFGVDLSTSVRDFAEVAALAVFPNPAVGAFTVDFELMTSATIDLQLYDSFGRLVARQRPGRLAAGRQRVPFDQLDQLPTGTYYLRMLVDGRSTRAVAVGLR
jgi:hypothetical protein